MITNVLPFRPRLADRGPAPLIRTRLPELPAPRITALTPWWTCPPFCDPDICFGGELYDFGTHRRIVDRRHGALLLSETVAQDDGGYVDVSVSLVAVEDPEVGFPDGVAIIASLGNLETTDVAAIKRIAVALESAAWHATQPLITRSPSEGGGRDLTSGRGELPRCRPARATTPLESA